MRCQDSNSQPSDYESPPSTTIQGLPPGGMTCYDMLFSPEIDRQNRSLYCKGN